MKKKIMVGVGPNQHLQLAHDEIEGLEALGHICKEVIYGRNNQNLGVIEKLYGVIKNAFIIVGHLYSFSPDILYLNSRFEPVASSRDGISLAIIKMLYWKKMKIAIKTHGSDLNLLDKRGFFTKNILLPILVHVVDVWFFLSSEEKEMVEKKLPALRNKIVIIPNIVEGNRYKPSQQFKDKYAIKKNNYNIFFAARMVAEKGCVDLLESIPLIQISEAHKLHFYFAGDGVELEHLKRKSFQYALTDRVHFLGFLDEKECDNFYPNVDLLVFPTYFNEGFPMTLFKAIASGLPVITTKIRAAKDYLSEPDNVLWVDACSPNQIAKTISSIYTNSNLRDQMSYNNKTLAKNFTSSKVCETINNSLS